MRSPVTALIEQYKALTDVEQKVFLDLVDPQPEPEAPAKQTRKKRGPSKKAQSLSTAITSSREAKAEANDGAASGEESDGPICGTCGYTEDYQDHFKPSPNYHEFEAPKVKKAAAQK